MAILADVKRSLRDMPPAHYTLMIESFSNLQKILEETERKSYESETFEAGGYKWKLFLYPNGDEERNGKGYISLYLVTAETDDLPLGWEVHAKFKLFIYDHINEKFLKIQDANKRARQFNRMKTVWGFAQLVPQSAFHDASNGFLIHDTCVFGAEISVCSLGKGEYLKPLKNIDSCHTWKINLFSSLKEEFYYSKTFTLANFKWNLLLYPKGHSNGAGKYLSLFICLQESNAPDRIYADIKLSILDQHNNKDWSVTGYHLFTAPRRGSGWPRYICLRNINDIRGLIVNDTLIIKVQIMSLSTLETF